ncbi:hypothetical protein MNBD_GAMMA12-449 [hydrothermal vent metagenome]|uniref:Uncharacterized protein n=1 Tax=hydrothermal vent metagenome TaxID=652676 RepID=A0A3B0YT50_9ZZZZ
MTKNDIDWSYLKKSAIWFFVSALATTTCWYISNRHVKTKINILQKAQQVNSAIRHKTSLAKQDANTIKMYQKPYKTLLDSGLIGEEHRMSWISSLRTVTSRLKLKSAKFQLSAQTVAKPQFIQTGGLLQVRKSRMKISLELPHEGDLLRVLAALEKEPGHYSANHCTIKRHSKKIVLRPNATNFTALCDLDWYSLKSSNDTGKYK